MITVKLSDIVNSTEIFSKIMKQSFKGSLAFKIARLARELDKEMQTFNTERQKIIEKYGEKDSDGNLITTDNGLIKFDNSVVQEVNNDFNSLLDTEIEINADKLPIDKIDEFEITPQEMISLEVFFE